MKFAFLQCFINANIYENIYLKLNAVYILKLKLYIWKIVQMVLNNEVLHLSKSIEVLVDIALQGITSYDTK